MDILDVIKQEHREVRELIDQIEPCEPGDEQLRQIAAEMSEKLTMHALNEEKLFYPRLRDGAEDEDERVDVFEAYTEHDVMKHLIALVNSGRKPDEKFKAELQVLGESVKHHVQEEESKIFKMAKELMENDERAKLGDQWQKLKERMQAEGVDVSGRKSSKRKATTRKAAAGKSTDRKTSRGAKAGARKKTTRKRRS